MNKYTIEVDKLTSMSFVTYIDFDDYGEEQLYIKYFVSKNHKPNEKYFFPKVPLGTFIIDLLNSYDKIVKLLQDTYNKLLTEQSVYRNRTKRLKKQNYQEYLEIKDKLDIDFNNKCITAILLLKKNLRAVCPKLVILNSEINHKINHFLLGYDNLLITQKEDLQKAQNGTFDLHYKIRENLTPEIFDKIKKERIKISMSLLRRTESISIFLRRIGEIALQYEKEITNIKKLYDTAFIRNSDSRNNRFNGKSFTLPKTTVNFNIDYGKTVHIDKFHYKITNLTDVAYATLYQLILNHKVVIKCKNCGKYLIPERTDKQYCDIDCKQEYMRNKTEENYPTVYQRYRTLYNRYKNNKTYKKAFEELKKIYYNQYRTKQIDNQTFMKILLDFEEKVKNSYTVKRGRPKKTQ